MMNENGVPTEEQNFGRYRRNMAKRADQSGAERSKWRNETVMSLLRLRSETIRTDRYTRYRYDTDNSDWNKEIGAAPKRE